SRCLAIRGAAPACATGSPQTDGARDELSPEVRCDARSYAASRGARGAGATGAAAPAGGDGAQVPPLRNGEPGEPAVLRHVRTEPRGGSGRGGGGGGARAHRSLAN